MNNMINFGIDLGTTNSLIAKFTKGTVEVFQDPIRQGIEVLPSVVGFRNDRILVGAKAKEYLEKDFQSVVGRFKLFMGTTRSFKIKSLGQSKTPIELSAFVLKELKRFIHTGETPEAVVITIPASFDMTQANATKEAGQAAGFKQVVLLNEPIAASLAYANKEKDVDLKNSQWIVYDLGGGTFDVALVKIVAGELKILDNEGNNYLGGSNFDELIVKRIVVPHLERKGHFTELLTQMTSETGKYNRLWYRLLARAEAAKIALSTETSAEIEIEGVTDDEGKKLDLTIAITRSEYEVLIKEDVDSTAEMLKKILTRNSLRPQDLKFVLMVGGATYTPYVRKRIEELVGIPVNTGINPTNAIAVGAAYFAATKEINLAEKADDISTQPGTLKIRCTYNRASMEREEWFAARVDGELKDLFYHITREDGAYDSGLKKLTARIDEDLPLREDTYNLFTFTVYDSHNNPVVTDFNSIQIAQGKYSVAGQMLPADLSLVLDLDDDGSKMDTKLLTLFTKNSVLPATAKKTVQVTKALIRGSDDEVRIIVVEGPTENHFTANKKVGLLGISGKQLQRDLLRGREIDLTFDLSESRDLTVHVYVNPSGPEFSGSYSPTFRDVPVELLAEEVRMLDGEIEKEKAEAMANENFEVAEKLEKLSPLVQELEGEAMLLRLDNVTADRYKLEDRKRKIAQELDQLTSGKRVDRLRNEYQAAKTEVTGIVTESGNDHERRQLNEIIAQEHTFLNSTSPRKLQGAIDQLHQVRFQILRRTPAFLQGWFQHLCGKRETLNDQLQAKVLIEAGSRHLVAEDYDKLLEVNMRLTSLLPEKEKVTPEMQPFTRITAQ